MPQAVGRAEKGQVKFVLALTPGTALLSANDFRPQAEKRG